MALSTDLLSRVLALPDQDRAELASVVDSTLSPQSISDSERQFLDQRLADMAANPMPGLPAADVFRDLDALIAA